MVPTKILKLFPNLTGYRKRAFILEEHKAFMLKVIHEHESSFQPGQCRDFIDVYLAQVVLILTKYRNVSLLKKFSFGKIMKNNQSIN